MKTLGDKDLILTLELARKIGCDEPFLNLLLKEIEQRKLTLVPQRSFFR